MGVEVKASHLITACTPKCQHPDTSEAMDPGHQSQSTEDECITYSCPVNVTTECGKVSTTNRRRDCPGIAVCTDPRFSLRVNNTGGDTCCTRYTCCKFGCEMVIVLMMNTGCFDSVCDGAMHEGKLYKVSRINLWDVH